jgi:hypothetical protein
MNASRIDSDRVLVIATLITGLVGVSVFLVVYLTVMSYGTLNETGTTYARLALYILAGTLILSIYLALAARSRALSTPGMSGIGWLLIAAGLILGFPALGGTIGLNPVPGVTSFGGVAGSMFLVLAGSALLQAEHNVRERNDDN